MRKNASFIAAALAWMALFAASAQAQPGPMLAPAAFKLQVLDPFLDLDHIPQTVLHLRFVNGTQETVSLAALHLWVDFKAEGDRNAGGCSLRYGSHSPQPAAPLLPGTSVELKLDLSVYDCDPAAKVSIWEARTFSIGAEMFHGGYGWATGSTWLPVKGTRTPDQIITAMLQESTDNWNRGDLDAFATSYKNSPDILFNGHKISRGYDQMLAAYKTGYPTRERMGTLSFTQLEVQPLDAAFATVTGHFHLERTPAGGGNADGYFMLVLEKTAGGWKIVRDDTTADPAK